MRSLYRAFTLIEILIVVVILGILAAIVVPQFASATRDAHAGNLRAQLSTVNRQIELYRIRTGVYPSFAATGTQLINGNNEASDWEALINSNLLNRSPSNPAYVSPSGSVAMEVTTVGAAGVKGVVGAGWCWNSVANTMYASFFDEDSGLTTAIATD